MGISMVLHNKFRCLQDKMYWAHSGLPTWVAHLGPISARRTLCLGSVVGRPSGAHKAVQMGPTWDPYRIPVGAMTLLYATRTASIVVTALGLSSEGWGFKPRYGWSVFTLTCGIL